MKNLKLILCTLLLSLLATTSVFAGAPALGTTKTGTPENGKKYYIYADTYSGGKYVKRYLYNDNGTLKMNANAENVDRNYVWMCSVTNGKYTFRNVGNPAKYLAHKALADAAYNFTLGKVNANHEGTTIWSDAAERYLVAKNDGSSFNQSTGTYNQTSGDWCTDYVFVEYATEGNTISISSNMAGAGSVSINGTATSLPFSEESGFLTFPLDITATANNPYKFLGFFAGEENMGTNLTIESLSEDISYEARYELEIFSKSFESGIPVQIYNTGNTSYAIKMNSQSDYAGKAVNSGSIAWGKNETWVLVGNASSFKMYNTVAGGSLALTLEGTGQNSAATLAAEGTELCINEIETGKFTITPVANKDQSLNMHGGAGQNIKLYASTDGNSKWSFRKIDLSKTLTLNYTTSFEGGKFVGNDKKVGYLTTIIDGAKINNTITETSTFTSGSCYLPVDAKFSMQGDPLHGWKIEINGGNSIPEQAIPAKGLTVNVNIEANPNDPYQYLYQTPDANGKPYRIPAIAAAPNGTIFAIADNRPCGNDIGYGEVDIKCRMSNDNGVTWGEEFFVADGNGGDSNVMETGFGDAAIVADRIENKLLVMMVCGKTVCHNGRWTPEATETTENINRVARVYATYNESKKVWEWTKPEEVTNSIYSLFLKDGKPTVTSMFIGSGRIAQSSKIKVGDYYRLYCSMWTRDGGNRVIYSDDFGGSWNILGTVDSRPAPSGDEPKCEELPDGSVLLSSRKYNGRYFNVFKYTNTKKAEGSWTGVVATNEVGDLKWGGNSTNGEPLLVGNVLFQSAPTGEGRSDVSVFYKVLSNDASTYTPTALSSGWTEIEISHRGSAYSAMCILPDKENIGLLYEEEPGGYCIVYRTLKLKELLTPEAYEALSTVQPTYASEASPVWNNIKFTATGNALYDNGTGNEVTAKTNAEADAAMWNIVGTKDAFYLISKLGNYLAYNAKNKSYTTTADKSEKVVLTLKENIKGSWEIMRKGANKSMSNTEKSKVAEATICGDNNQITFIDLTPKVYEPNIFSTVDNPKYFQVQFKAGGANLADQGAGNNIKTANADNVDAQYWQFIGTPESFYMKSKAGNYVYFADSRFKTSSTNKVELNIIKNAAEGYYEIGRTGVNNKMNQNGGAGAGKELGEWGAGDTNNPLRFVEEQAEPIALPYFSTEEEPEYWWLQFNAGGAVLKDNGAGVKAKTADKAYNDAQLWQLVGDESSFYMKNKAGNYLSWNGERFTTTATAESKATLILHETGKADATGCYEIQIKGGGYMNQSGGAGAGKELGTWNYGDTNNPFRFISAEATYPNFDDENSWYYIKFGNGGWVIEDKGAESNVQTAKLDDYNTQKWRVTGTKDNCQIINKEGHYLVYENNVVKAKKTEDPQGFKLVETTNDSYPMQLEIQHNSTANKAFNMSGGAGKDKNIALHNANDGGNPLTFVPVESIVFNEFSMGTSNATAPAEKLTLWYTQPATATGVSNTWMEYSLPLGNGQFGASLFGGVARDEILFNDKTVWSGAPGTYGEYLPFGSVFIEDISGNFTFNPTKPVQNYYRDLNLKTATGTVTFENAEGVKFTRQYIASNPDKAIVSKITASEAGKLNLRITMASGKPTVNAETTYNNGYAQFTGKLQTVSYNATLKVVTKGGITSTGAEGITVEDADEVLLVLVGSTDFVGNDPTHISGNAENMPAENKAQADKVAEKGWDAVYAAHVADHQKFFTRVEFELDGVENNLPTNELITAYNAASGARNLMLEQLYYNYGRYLSIASSRGVDLPNNLQGIWNNTCSPPWHSDIHANINVQMNYWPVSAGNLNEMYEPFLNYIINEAAQPEWRTLASNAVNSLNATLGTSTPVREDSWTCLTENNIFGGISGFAPNYVIANAWYVTHMWQHYRYTLDKEYLAKAFPAMKGSSLFWADRMVLAEDGKYECPNEYSPEHGPGSENAVAHAQQIAWESIDNTIKAADILGGVKAGIISQDDYDLLKDRLENMDRGLAIETYEAHEETGWPAERNGIKTGDKLIREWKYSRFYVSNDKGHRHMSHLMALFPFGQLTEADGELFEAAINSMKLRGDESTGWSMGWKINLWARALMPERSHAVLRKALKHSTTYGTDQGQGGIYYNLFDSHAPFQIDGNFGAASGINEMLLQSHTEVINILPALPAEWSKGYVKGLKAVGDFTVDIKWEGNQARKVVITNNQGQPCYVKCVGLDKATATINGVKVKLVETTHSNLPCYEIASNAGDEIVIDLSNATQSNKTALETLITETENLINECYDYYATEAALQTTNADGDYYVSTNADHNDYNVTKDGDGIAALIDGNNDTFLHTNWNSNVTGIKEAHFIELSLGTENAISDFKFKYATRKAETDFPKTIEIQGSNNGTDFVAFATVTNLPVGNKNETKFYTSNVIKSETAYSHLRFVVTATNSGNKEGGGNQYFHMAEFDLMPRTAEYVNNYPNAVNVPVAVEKANTAIVEAEKALTATQTVTEYNASLAALQAAYDRLVAAIESGNLPVLITNDTTKPYIYKIGIKRSDNTVLQYDYAGTGMVAVAEYNASNMNQDWYFTKGSANGKVFIHPYLAGGDVLSAKSTQNSPAAVWGAVKGAETHQEWQILVVNKENGTYNIKAGDDSNYFSNNGGTGNKMGFWSGDSSNDTGSLFTFTEVEFDGGIWYNTLNEYNNVVCTETEVADGTTIGYYMNGAAYNSAKVEASSILADAEATEKDYKEAYTTLRAAKEAMKFIVPEAGKYYTFKNDTYYITSGVTNGKIALGETKDATAIYYYDGSHLLAYATGLYFGLNSSDWAFEAIGSNDISTIEFIAAANGEAGKFNIKSADRWLHRTDAYVNRCTNNTCGNDHNWTVEEVKVLPVTVTAAGYSTFYAPVALEVADEVKAYTVTINGEWATLNEIEDGIIPANTGVVIAGNNGKKATGGTYDFNITTTEATYENNELNGTVAATYIADDAYVLGVADNEIGFYTAIKNQQNNTAWKNNSHKAYLPMPADGSGVSFYGFRWDDETTEIEDVVTENAGETIIFDLQGRRVSEITAPGIYIINGKKVLVK